MEHIDYFKLQAKNLLKDFKTRFFDEKENFYNYKSKYFDIMQAFSDFGLPDEKDDFKFTLMNAQHIVAKIAGFSKWNDLNSDDESGLQFAHRQFDKSIYRLNAKQIVEKIEEGKNQKNQLPAPKNLYAFIIPTFLGLDITFTFDAVEYAQSYLVYANTTNDTATARPLVAGNFSPIKHFYRNNGTAEEFFWVRAYDGKEYGEWSELASKNR